MMVSLGKFQRNYYYILRPQSHVFGARLSTTSLM